MKQRLRRPPPPPFHLFAVEAVISTGGRNLFADAVVPRNQKEPNVYQVYTKSRFLVDGFQYVKEKVMVWAYVGMGIQVLDVFQYVKERALSKMLPGKVFLVFQSR